MSTHIWLNWPLVWAFAAVVLVYVLLGPPQ
jgi:hypothetical protein